jgi:hypothetical protein
MPSEKAPAMADVTYALRIDTSLGFDGFFPSVAIECLMADTYNSNLRVDRLPCFLVSLRGGVEKDERAMPVRRQDYRRNSSHNK